ncbi:hypothetical protein [Indioceanicola profundi]|uniref:hypothetical protein n=1 Tax=Indioceanicola profundi TaxID=2220096 RepID=UPI000E6AA7D8|nr:hypothetical protein [Indioceanicola profundi]
MLKQLMIAASLLLLPVAASAQDGHGHSHGEGANGPHGGVVQDLAGYEAELVPGDGTVTLYLVDHATEALVPTEGMMASVLFTQGSVRKGTVVLQPVGDRLEGKGEVPEGADAVVSLRGKDGKSSQARFELGGHAH